MLTPDDVRRLLCFGATLALLIAAVWLSVGSAHLTRTSDSCGWAQGREPDYRCATIDR